MTFGKTPRVLAAGLAAGLAASALWTGTAQAATTVNCVVNAGNSGCITATIPASSAHKINFYAEGGFFCAQADIQIIDAANKAVVYHRHIGAGTVSGTVGGLYGSYYLRVYWSCGGASGKISN
ncbi:MULTISPECIES: hypothetical protein [unclassified Streptosporangium]|uniref:hypothetical protein n=1 Tax=unclassified Streptosporangium TaxID=2632669 RepID=UPI002E2C344A|nr:MULTISPECIES: hypothetical protein [unclassified Streptosporangium]